MLKFIIIALIVLVILGFVAEHIDVILTIGGIILLFWILSSVFSVETISEIFVGLCVLLFLGVVSVKFYKIIKKDIQNMREKYHDTFKRYEDDFKKYKDIFTRYTQRVINIILKIYLKLAKRMTKDTVITDDSDNEEVNVGTEISVNTAHLFWEAIDMQEHPIKNAKKKIQIEYITALGYLIEKIIDDEIFHQVAIKEFVVERLHLYQTQLFSEVQISTVSEDTGGNCVRAFCRPWRRKYCFMLACDMALILLEESLILKAMVIIRKEFSKRSQANIAQVFSMLQNEQGIEEKYLPISSLIMQYRANKSFFTKNAKKIIVTANTSAGKSTLINALIGKPIASTSQEVCTGNVCYFFNKAYEDKNIHLLTQNLNLHATEDDLRGYDWNGCVSIASYFVGVVPNIPRLCLIDTPGVDAVLYQEHSKRAHDALLNENYDVILYVVCPTRLGTDAEIKHLEWIAQHLQKDKIIFVLNKLDEYRDFSDSIEESIQAFKKDLLGIGFENPVICPISAYASYLLKLKMTGQALSEDEADEYALYLKKFKRDSYDLSLFYEGVQCLANDSEEIIMSKRVGLYGLEKIIYGGTS